MFRYLLYLSTIFYLSYGQQDGTCSASKSCDQGCCGKSGYCGFGPSYCGNGNCTSNCDAQAECGQYAPSGKFNCPLNVCCSQYGFCGTTELFCGSKCQAGCAKVTNPSCYGGSASRMTIGYYESWSYRRACDAWKPENINANLWTHLNYAFALIGPDHRIAQMNDYDVGLYTRVTGLKDLNANLKVYIAVGGWAAGGKSFSNMVATSGNRATFIQSAMTFMRTYGFDGIDIDWEYPAASDRGGVAADTRNFVLLLQELKAACGSRYGVTATLPSSYWYMRGFDVVGMEPHVDWFNFMSYDIHGTWDGNSPFTRRIVQPHTNLTEISEGLNLLWRNKIDPRKVVLGLAFYGRSFTLKNTSCKTPGCAFSGGGNPGSCTKTSGILSNAEIQRIIKSKNLTPKLDSLAAVKYITWDTNQWVSYDDDETLAMKQTYANNKCLGGTMVWALDLADPNNDDSLANLKIGQMAAIDGPQAYANKGVALAKWQANFKQNGISLLIFWTPCSPNPVCPPGFTVLTTGHGKIFDADRGQLSGDGCHGGGNGYNRALCIEANVRPNGCGWYGKPKSCSQSCPKNTILITQNSHIGGASTGCQTGHFSSFCCASLESNAVAACPNPNMIAQLSGGLMPRAAEKYHAYDNIYNYGNGTYAECAFQNNPYNGISEGADAPNFIIPEGDGAIWQGVLGQWQIVGNRMNFVPWDGKPYPLVDINLIGCTTTVTRTAQASTVTGAIKVATCDYNKLSQCCQHYSSVARTGANSAATLVCPVSAPNTYRSIVNQYNMQHTAPWDYWVSWAPPAQQGLGGSRPYRCERDEYPPVRFKGSPQPFIQWVRRTPAQANQRAGQLWKDVCNVKTESTTQGGEINDRTCTEMLSLTYTVPRFSMAFRNMPNDPEDGISSNWCQLVSSLTWDPGYALLTNDAWYGLGGRGGRSLSYRFPIPTTMTSGKTPPRNAEQKAKRWLELPQLEIEDLIVDDGNVTRLRSEDELWEKYGLQRCQTHGCAAELGAYDQEKSVTDPTTIPEVAVTATAEVSTAVRTRPKPARGSVSPPMRTLSPGM